MSKASELFKYASKRLLRNKRKAVFSFLAASLKCDIPEALKITLIALSSALSIMSIFEILAPVISGAHWRASCISTLFKSMLIAI